MILISGHRIAKSDSGLKKIIFVDTAMFLLTKMTAVVT